MMPPFSTDKTSRVRFLDLDPLLPELRREGTLFMPESIRIERSGIYKFNDEPYIEKVVFGKYGCPETTSSFRTNMSRAVVNYDVDERLLDCAMVSPEHGVVMMNTNEGCGPSVLQGEEVYHFEWEPRCPMLVLAADNERQYLDEAMRAGRLLSDPFLVSVNFTVGLGPNLDAALVGTNCAHSRLMMKNYELDTTLHAEYRELKQVRDDLVTYNDLLKFWQHVLASRRFSYPQTRRRRRRRRPRAQTRPRRRYLWNSNNSPHTCFPLVLVLRGSRCKSPSRSRPSSLSTRSRSWRRARRSSSSS